MAWMRYLVNTDDRNQTYAEKNDCLQFTNLDLPKASLGQLPRLEGKNMHVCDFFP